jgi:AhpD family alkylhydroperoxidase
MNQTSHIATLPRKALLALMELESYTKTTSVCLFHKHLIKIRASQINDCRYCLEMHTTEANAHGETNQRIAELTNWKRSTLFDAKEKLILALTEHITHTDRNHDDTQLFAQATAVFGKDYLVEVLMIIVTINTWNRVVRSYDQIIASLKKAELNN